MCFFVVVAVLSLSQPFAVMPSMIGGNNIYFIPGQVSFAATRRHYLSETAQFNRDGPKNISAMRPVLDLNSQSLLSLVSHLFPIRCNIFIGNTFISYSVNQIFLWITYMISQR